MAERTPHFFCHMRKGKLPYHNLQRPIVRTSIPRALSIPHSIYFTFNLSRLFISNCLKIIIPQLGPIPTHFSRKNMKKAPTFGQDFPLILLIKPSKDEENIKKTNPFSHFVVFFFFLLSLLYKGNVQSQTLHTN
jgi:hypothetical protein